MKYLLFLYFSVSLSYASNDIVTVSGMGVDPASAFKNILESEVPNFVKIEGPLGRSILQDEILVNAASFVPTYKVIESDSVKNTVKINADIALDVIRALFAFNAPSMGEDPKSKVLLLVRNFKVTDIPRPKSGGPAPNPFTVLEQLGKERFARRQFTTISPDEADLSSLSPIDDISNADLLRTFALKANTRLALGINAKSESGENENTHQEEDRIVITGTLLDTKSGAVLSRATAKLLAPRGKAEFLNGLYRRALLDETKDFFQDLFVGAGRQVLGAGSKSDITVLRVVNPVNAVLVGKFRTAVQASREIKSIVEYRLQRGAYDFAVKPALDFNSLAKVLKNIKSEDFILEGPELITNETNNVVVVKLARKVEKPLIEKSTGEKGGARVE